ncbi:hypothetical protein WOLCODRAFT_146165 [Wolfiporia cocos MD-104 SS10]|uniref:Kinetochore protein Sos7 coiled-coil domain-containing protein n=1 Tax=Wolfiporia cocos (strain MD-104) TaxID=742152 RepID=A0A2H3J1U6_WOLCO|nr:hypothetical protein WOLCODRAFT_146165 [Wolfiporia cocos MD-104 SS10]
MPATMEAEHTARLEAARALQSTLEGTRLRLLEDRDIFDSHQSLPESDLGQILEGRGLTDPAILAMHVASQVAFMRKLKIQYLEQKAKDQYIKTIVSDDAPNINAADNEVLRLRNEEKKANLKLTKARLAEKDGDIHKLAPLVEQDFHKAKALTAEASDLARNILDARLQLTRLKQVHPHPRLTISSAHAQLDAQVVEMQTLMDEQQSLNEQIEQVKEKVKEGAKEIERLRLERAETEKAARAGKEEVEDSRVIGLYDWLTLSLAWHRSLHSVESIHSASENELHLTYAIAPPPSTAAERRRVRIVLLFVPNTRQIADAQVEGLNEDLGDVIDAHIQANDVPGLIAAILARARAGS